MLAEQQAALIADVHEIMRERTPTRNALVAHAGGGDRHRCCRRSRAQGFEPFAEEWQRLDTLADAPVRVISGAETTFGTRARRRARRHVARRRGRRAAAIRFGRSELASRQR